jgi:hypothetical protein
VQKPKQPHLPFLDWMRGLAAAIMLQGHTYHSFSRPEQRELSPYVLSQFFGGFAPALFLFLTGVTYAFILESAERRGKTRGERWLVALGRVRYFFLIAFLFRIQLWVFAWGQSSWTDIFKVDVLNLMGLTVLLLSPLAVIPAGERVRWAVLAGLVFSCGAPLVSALDLGWMHPFVRHYFVPDYNYFALFPWGSFIAFGMAAGSLLKLTRPEHLDRALQWSAITGFAVVLAAQFFTSIPYSVYPVKTELWLNGPGLIFIKTGVVLIVAALAYLWQERLWGASWSWLRQLGTTSLLVYWVHIEIVYGRWLGAWKERLDPYQCGLAAACVILLMLGLSVLKTRLKDRYKDVNWRAWWPAANRTQTAAGD